MIPPSLSVTMKDVAAELGVSVTTISKVLNNHADIGEATRQRVLAKVEELGYRRNAVARSLTIRRTHTLGVIVSDLMHSFFVEVVSAIEETLGRQGYGLLLCNLGEDPSKERWQLEMLLERQVDGVILASTNAQKNGDLLRRLQSQGKGLVLIDRDDHQGLRCHRVVTDDEQVGRLATSHLISLGHRHIAPLVGPAPGPRPAPAPRLPGVDAAGGPARRSTAGWSKRVSSRRTATTPPSGC